MSRERTEACDAVDDALARVSISWSKVNDAQDAEYRVAVRVWMQALMMQRSAVEIYLAEIDGTDIGCIDATSPTIPGADRSNAVGADGV
jgi:hypothetical protein